MSRRRTEQGAASVSLPERDGGWHRLLPTGPSAARRRTLEAESEEGEAHRCTCGSLLARLVASGVELKCRRCKRIVVLPFHTERPR